MSKEQITSPAKKATQPVQPSTSDSYVDHGPAWFHLIKYALVGMFFGIVFIKAEVVSWYRIQEMFHFASFHMYGIIGSAVMVGMLSVWLIKKFHLKSANGEVISLSPKIYNHGQIYGGLLFGFGWAMTGACPGPMYALIGSGVSVFVIVLISAVIGTYTFGYFRDRLPR